MSLPIRFAVVLVAASLLAPPAFANDDEEDGWEPYEGYRLDWSGTFQLRLRDFDSPADDDDVTGFFDLHEFTRNKDDQPTVDFGLSAFDLDLFAEDETPLVQFRLRSPTSDLNFSGESFQIDEFLLNQRAELFARPRGLALDLDYRRMRNDEMRVYPNPTDQTGALMFGDAIAARFNDDTRDDDRFFLRRGRIGGELRVRPRELFTGERGALGGFLSEIALRGGYEEREGQRQVRYLLGFSDGAAPFPPGNALWRGITSEVDQRVSDGGAGLVFTPGGLFTLAVDFDHQRFRNRASTLFQTQINRLDPNIGAGSGFDQIPNTLDDQRLRTVAFIPDTNRTTGSVRLHTRIGERAVIHGGLQVSSLNQEGNRTPLQEIAGLRGNKVLFYSGNLAADLELTDALSMSAFYKFDHRSNKLPRDTRDLALRDWMQVDPFLKHIRRNRAGVELVYRFLPMNLVAVGWRGLWIDRELKFADAFDPNCLTVTNCTLPALVGPNLAILSDNTVLNEKTRMYTLYLRTALRPIRGLQFSGEGGYRNAPDTGYSRELDDLRYGQVRTSYVLPLKRPVTVSLFGRAQHGETDDFTAQPTPARSVFRNGEVERLFIPPRDRDFERDGFSWGATLAGSPCDNVTLFTSVFQHRDNQDIDLYRSTVLRYEEPFALFNTFVDLDFFKDTKLRYRTDHSTLILGGSYQIARRTDLSLAYTFTRTNTRLRSDGLTSNTLDGWSRFRSDIHRVQLEIGHWFRDGLRVSLGYHFDQYRDRTRVPTGVGSADPFNPSTHVNTFMLGVTLNSDLLR
jgi:hypothetical protein